MGRRGQRVQSEPKPVPLSEWFKQAPGRPVTRAQLLNVFAALIERRLHVERIIRQESKLYMRFLIWLWPGLSKLPTHVQTQAAELALRPEGALPDDEEEEQDEVTEEVAAEITDLGSRIMDRRSGR